MTGPRSALLIVDSLQASGPHDILVLAGSAGLVRQISQKNPDIVLVDVTNPSRDILEDPCGHVAR